MDDMDCLKLTQHEMETALTTMRVDEPTTVFWVDTFLIITRVLVRILMEHIGRKNSLYSNLHFIYIFSIIIFTLSRVTERVLMER